MNSCSSILGENAGSHDNDNEASRSNRMNMHGPGNAQKVLQTPQIACTFRSRQRTRIVYPFYAFDAVYAPHYFSEDNAGLGPGYALLASNFARTGESNVCDVCDPNPSFLPSLHNNRQSLLALSKCKYLCGIRFSYTTAFENLSA